MERRDMIKGATFAAMAGLISPGQAMADLDEHREIERLNANYTTPLNEYLAEYNELVTYYKLLKANNLELPNAISVPYATEPMSMYMRIPEWQQTLDAPKIPLINQLMVTKDNSSGMLTTVINSLACGLKMMPKSVKIVDKVDTSRIHKDCKSDRIVSPRFVIDTDSAAFSERVTANILFFIAEGIWEEARIKLRTALNAHKVMEKPGSPRIRAESTLIRLHFGNGPEYMLELHGSVVGAGMVLSKEE